MQSETSAAPSATLPKIITVFNQKGGCAKTMTTMQVAGTLAHRGLKVLVADVDPQNTSTLWSMTADEGTPFPASVVSFAAFQDRFVEKLLPVSTKYDVVVIDCPPALGSNVPWAALGIADLALVPVIPVMDNVWASRAAEDLILRNRELRASMGNLTELKAAYLFSMVRRGNVFTECRKTLTENAQIPVLQESISMRNAFPECQMFGCSVHSFGPSPAAKEVDAVVDRVIDLIGLPVKKSKAKGKK